MTEATIVPLLVYCAWFGGVGSWAAGQCGRGAVEGFVLGVMLGPLGAVLIALLPRPAKKEPAEPARHEPPAAKRPQQNIGRSSLADFKNLPPLPGES